MIENFFHQRPLIKDRLKVKMVKKFQLTEHFKWPVFPSDAKIGDPMSPVAVVTLGTELDSLEPLYSIAGPCKTENTGIEKVVANVISNPNIRFLILCGSEVAGHKTGACFVSLYENGVDEKSNKIINAPGAIPFIENIPHEAIERFREQVKLVNLIDIVDTSKIEKTIKDYLNKDLGAFEEEPIIVEIKELMGPSRIAIAGREINLLPEFNINLDPYTGLVSAIAGDAFLTLTPFTLVVAVKTDENKKVFLLCKSIP